MTSVTRKGAESALQEMRVQRWIIALDRMVGALELLDQSDAPPEVGAQLDLAIHRLKEEIAAAQSAWAS